jgi:hypothetical protein
LSQVKQPEAAAGPVGQAGSRQCASCGEPRTGPYCAQCGQREMQGRHTLRSMIGGALGRLLNLERGFVHTAWKLTVAPGAVIRDFLAGRTVRYAHPFGYLLIAVAAFALLAQPLGVVTGGGNDRVFVLLLVPFVAGVSRLLFWRAELCFAEHLIVGMYAFGHIVLLLTLLQPATLLLGGAALRMLVVGALILAVAYLAWAYSRVFSARPLLAALGGLAALAGGIVVWGVAMTLIVGALRH